MRTRSLFRINRLMLVVLLVVLLASLVPVRPVYAASILVNISADNYNPADGKCTLREAIDAANLNVRSGTAAGECAAGSPTGVDTISFHPGFAPYVITAGSGGTNPKQLPYIISEVQIIGLGATNTIIQASDCNPTTLPNGCTPATWRVFQVTPTGNLTLNGLTVRNGQCNGVCQNFNNSAFPNAGGGIYSTGTLTVTNSAFSGNSAVFGGGIFNFGGTLTVNNSTFSGNTAGDGGGIMNYEHSNMAVNNSTFLQNHGEFGGGVFNNGTMTMTNSTLSGNTGKNGSGIYNYSVLSSALSTLTLTNSTLSGNAASLFGGGILNFTGSTLNMANNTLSGNTASSGGGIYNAGTLDVTNNTLSANTAQDTGGLFNYFSSSTLRNTILANNSGGNCTNSGSGSISNGGNNLDSGTSCGFGFNLNSLSNTNPVLGPLANNGGLTQTMKLLPGSPAIDHGNISFCSASPVNGKDQRGVLRPLGANCDMGAFETSNGAGPGTVGVFRPSNGLLYLKNSNTTGFADMALNYGIPGDYPVVGDWDGNGTDTIGVYRNGWFYLRNSNTVGIADIVFGFGQPGDQPIAGDWNRDGVDTVGLYRPSTGQFFLRNDVGPTVSFYLGNVGDVAIAGDWNGDGVDTVGVFRPSNGVIFLKNTNTTGFADVSLNYGIPGDKPVTGDWNYDGIDTIGVYRNGTFYLRNINTMGFADMIFALGIPGDMPIAGNWDAQP